jgi:hypothetical protein
MPLTEEQKQAIRDEEFFRAEVRKELASGKRSFSLLERMSMFFETKAGFWLLTTVLAGVVATGLTAIQRYFDREEIVKRETADRARRDTETMLKLGPMLTSEKRSDVDMAMVLLDGLASDEAVDRRVATQVKALFQSTLAAGLKQDATPEEKVQANAILAFADRARVTAIQSVGPPSTATAAVGGPALSAALDDAALPVRIYIQINNEKDRTAAAAAAQAFRRTGLVVPGIEMVPTQNSPQQNSVRYCENKVSPDALERVRTASAAHVSPEPKLVVLDARLCGKVRFNHFELWFARGVS